MDKLFNEICSNKKWKPVEGVDYSEVNIEQLKRLADNHFDKLNHKGEFFFEYNDVLNKIDLLNKYIQNNKK